MNQKVDVRKITLVGLGIALNLVGGFVALTLRLPIYLDSIGTIMIAFLLGPKYGILTGILGNLIGGITHDIYALYFIPAQISVGALVGYLADKEILKGKRMPLGILAFSVPTSIISAMIAAYVFEGITSSGSSYFVQILKVMGIPDVMSVFLTQLGMDYLDKYVAVILVIAVLKIIPNPMKISQDKNS